VFGGGEEVACYEEIADFRPVDCREVEAESDPAARADIGGEIVALGLRSGEGGVFAREHFAGYGDDAVAAVIVEEIGEDFFADSE
jgi:hypothetical protein